MKLAKAVLLAATTTLIAASAQAGVVSVKADKGETEVTGEVIGFNGEKLTLLTSVGILSFDADKITCDGSSCPTTPTKTKLTVAAN